MAVLDVPGPKPADSAAPEQDKRHGDGEPSAGRDVHGSAHGAAADGEVGQEDRHAARTLNLSQVDAGTLADFEVGSPGLQHCSMQSCSKIASMM